MLISPPFLPVRDENKSDAEWLNLAMNSVSSNFIPELGNETIAGAYPVSMELGWHGGSHLIAPPGEEAETLPARAIADGTVIYVRQPKAQNRNDDEPLNYGAPEGSSCWTSDGTVLVRHETDIGASPDGQAISVAFYSLYMHLDSIAEGVARNRRIYRKAELGSAGYIYGQPHRIHFEIFCDDENLHKLTGRQSGELPLEADGRNNVVFGEMYFYLPAGSHLYTKQPPANQTTPTEAPTYTTEEYLFVGLRYAEGDGIIGQRGDATVTTYHGDGTPEGEPLIERDAEYKLYAKAKAIAEAYPTTGRPAPSAVYELLRFGRVINAANETLSPPDVPHWRQVKYPGGQGWANLNAKNVRKFSDADFPHWKGWSFIDDSADQDSRCDSPTIRRWFNTNLDAWVDIAEAREGLSNQALLHKLEHTICKFPIEWRADTIEQRWAWLMHPENENFEALSDNDFKDFKAHAQALCFWEQVPTQTPALPDNPWRFHPRWFIQLLRKCGWLSQEEFAQCFPRKLLHLKHTQFQPQLVNWKTANTRANRWKLAFNRATRKYGISASKERLIHLFAHVIPETGYLSLVREGDGENRSYNPYYGRGLIQLTHLENYKKYGEFRKFPTTSSPPQYRTLGWDPDELVARNNTDYNTENCADSAGFYVAQRVNMLAHLDAGVEIENAIIASKDVNGYVAIEKLNGLDSRLQSVMYLKNIILDMPFPSAPEPLRFTWRRNSQQEIVIGPNGQPEMTGNPPRIKKRFYPATHSMRVTFEHQKP